MNKNIILLTCLFAVFNCFSQTKAKLKTVNELSDEFENLTSISNWKVFNIEENLPNKIKNININETEKGCLFIEPYTSCWYAGYNGIYLFKDIEGDFIISTKLKIEGKKDELPMNKWSIAGLLIRQAIDTTFSQNEKLENWVYINTGRGKEPEWVIDSKYTINSKSTFINTKSKSDWIELRIVRIHSLFITMYKFPNEKWTIYQKYLLDKLPNKLQSGINVSANATFAFNKPFAEFNTTNYDSIDTDMKVKVDYVRYHTVKYQKNIQDLIKNNKLLDISDEQISDNFTF